MSLTKLENGLLATPLIGSGLDVFSAGNVWFVDGDSGSNGNTGASPDFAKSTIQSAVTAAVKDGGVIYIKARDMGSTASDPVDYAETVIIPAGSSRMALIGVSGSRAQGGLPQIKKGSGSTALLTVRAPGCLIANLGFNGTSATGGGILLEYDGGSTKDSFGTTIMGCHFKNCVGSTATNAATGGAIQLSGAPWQVLIKGNRFYKNVGGIVLKDTTTSVPQDLVIESNSFGDSAASVDCDIYLAGGGGPGVGLLIRGNDFGTLPALASGSNVRWMDLTGADGGIVCGNFFGNDLLHGAAGSGSKIPTTVFFSGNFDAGASGFATVA